MNRFLLLPLMAMLATGCANQGPQTKLVLRGDPRGEAVYRFRQTLWRQDAAAPEFVGFGQVPFYNDPLGRGYDPRWPRTGFVTFFLHAQPQLDGQYDITILGPSGAIGPGDSEVLRGVARPVKIEQSNGTRTVDFADVPIRSRNHPDTPFTLSGTIIGTASNESAFERQMREFETQLSWRQPR